MQSDSKKIPRVQILYDRKTILLVNQQIEPAIAIERKTGRIELIHGKVEYSGKRKIVTCALFGIISIANQAALLFVQSARTVAQFMGHPILTVADTNYLTINSTFGAYEPNFESFNTKMLEIKNLLRHNFMICFDCNLTCPIQTQRLGIIDERFAWNITAMSEILKLEGEIIEKSRWFVPFVQGTLQTVRVPCNPKAQVQVYIFYRRSKYMGGTRFLSRGIDQIGHPANYVESQLVVIHQSQLWSYVMVRGSVPVIWSQQSVNADIVFSKDPVKTRSCFRKHIGQIAKSYAEMDCVDLLSPHVSNEKRLMDRFRQQVEMLNQPNVRYINFDYHHQSKQKNFEEIEKFVAKLVENVTSQNNIYYEIDGKTLNQQAKVVRVNCLDCMDRTNIMTGRMFQTISMHLLGVKSGSAYQDNFRNAIKSLGDWVSRIYSGSNSTLNMINHDRELGFFQKIGNTFKSAERMYQQSFYDELKQQAFLSLLRRNQDSVPMELMIKADLADIQEEGGESNYIKGGVLVISFNAADTLPQSNFFKEVGLHEKPGLVVVGLQQICELNASSIILSSNEKRVMDWRHKLSVDLKNCFGQFYSSVMVVSLVGLCLFVFRNHGLEVKDVITSIVKTGAAGMLGNKGAVAINLAINDQLYTFINVHLCSGEDPVSQRQRKEDIARILGLLFTQNERYKDRLQFKCSSKTFILGDLNTRLKMSYDQALHLLAPFETDSPADAEERIMKAFKYDQLCHLLDGCQYLKGFKEPKILFAPTYKYVKGETSFDRKKGRVPSWCDRIMYRGKGLSVNLFCCLRRILDSDHRPIACLFSSESTKDIRSAKLQKHVYACFPQ